MVVGWVSTQPILHMLRMRDVISRKWMVALQHFTGAFFPVALILGKTSTRFFSFSYAAIADTDEIGVNSWLHMMY